MSFCSQKRTENVENKIKEPKNYEFSFGSYRIGICWLLFINIQHDQKYNYNKRTANSPYETSRGT
jgi:hypothetical protein